MSDGHFNELIDCNETLSRTTSQIMTYSLENNTDAVNSRLQSSELLTPRLQIAGQDQTPQTLIRSSLSENTINRNRLEFLRMRSKQF